MPEFDEKGVKRRERRQTALETDLYAYENNIRANGVRLVCGIDEAGRGPLAGPVFAAAVILPEGVKIQGLNDSKQVPEKRRNLLFDRIRDVAVSYAVAMADEKEVDRLNILNATFLAMKWAFAGLKELPELALVDGNRDPHLPAETLCVVKGDCKCASIAAASILAKVSRDRYMLEMDRKYPQYCFAKHKGYPTKLHYEMIEKYGICDIHRKSFLKNIDGGSRALG